MSLYMSQFAYTSETWGALVKNPEDRTPAVRSLMEKAGGKLISLFYTFGDYDGIVIWEAPDETTITAAIIAALAPGHLKAFKTTTLLTPEQVVQALRRAGKLEFKGPKK